MKIIKKSLKSTKTSNISIKKNNKKQEPIKKEEIKDIKTEE